MQLRSGQQLTSLAQLSRMKPGSAMAAAIVEATGAFTTEILITKIVIKPQDRTDFTDIDAFAGRLKMVGHVHTAILVRAMADEQFELIFGERRVRGSMLNGWEKIPAKVFPATTPDFVIRMYQVSENFDRKPLSAKETALGLASDIDRFGREQAARLWTNPKGKQRSESWISKHLRFRKYGPITRELFDAGMFDDIEAANKMDDIEAEGTELARELAKEMKAGEKLGRVTLEVRFAQFKGAAQLTENDTTASPAAAARSPVPLRLVDDSRASSDPAKEDVGDSTHVYGETAGRNSAPPGAAATTGESVLRTSPPQTSSSESVSRQQSKQGRTGAMDSMKTVVWRAEELFQKSTDSIHRLRQLQADLAAAGVPEEDADWRLWVAFVQLACSALVGVGQPRAGKMINRLNDELNSKSPIELLNTLHPSRRAGVLPDDFRYDTGREIHPLAPNNWAL